MEPGVLVNSVNIPWTPLAQPVIACRVVLVTTFAQPTAISHAEPLGDPGFRSIPAGAMPEELVIPHDYYDHRDAVRDINIVFPIERLREFAAQGEVGEVSPMHLGCMGHIDAELVSVLRQQTAPAAAALLVEQQVDMVLLFPA
jgi:D-proline reductase (dithiol) PrdB